MHRESDQFPSCEVCGRTILKGEPVHEYVAPQGERHGVCSLCRSRAESSGWIPAERYGTVTHAPPSRTRRGEAIRRRLASAASRARSTAKGARDATAAEPPAEEAPKAEPPPRAEPPPKRRPAKPRPRQRAKPQPKRQGAGRAAPRRPRARRGPEALMRRAVQRFNGSEETRKVAGLIRSLGEPHAAVRADPSRQLALVTVAWELSWYQWEVSAEAGSDGESDGVREIAKGDEVSELAEEMRAWNAAVAEDGKLRLRAASRRKPSGQQA